MFQRISSIGLVLGLGLGLVQVVTSFIVLPCPGSTDHTCSFTPPGVLCPTNYYCPQYPSYTIIQFNATLQSSKCLVGPAAVAITNSSEYQVICPCQPGLYCPPNTETPQYCPQGNYCPPNTNILVDIQGEPISASGLGTWGEEIFQCPKDHFCPTGLVAPIKCSALSRCPAGTIKAIKTPTWILIGFIIAILAIFFAVLEFTRSKKRKLQDLAMNKDHVDAEESTNGGVHNPLDVNNRSFDMTTLKDGSGIPTATQKTSTKLMEGGHESYLIEFKNMSLTLKNGTCVMDGVNGSFKPGRLCAIMGPSGAGKTTIINLVTGKVKPTSGQVFVNGEELPGLTKYQKLLGFVPQEDIMIRELTVRDNISFSARYRLPATLSEAEIEDRINSTISELGIPHVQHTIIGDEHTRGVSGGQRKRVNIGLELVAAPKVLFLDEPTSGLDSTTATSLCHTLKSIAVSKNMTVIAVVHQPSLTSFLEFDDLLLLGKGGRVVYHGPLDDAPGYFASIGFPLPDLCNPADFYLDVVAGAVARHGHKTFHWAELFDLWEDRRADDEQSKQSAKDFRTSSLSMTAKIEVDKAQRIVNEPAISAKGFFTSLTEFFFEILYSIEDFVVGNYVDFVAYWGTCGSTDPIRQTRSGFYQFVLCTNRAFKQIFNGFTPFVLEMFLHLLAGAVISSAANRLYFVGPYPSAVCAITALPFQSDCVNPQVSQYVQVANFMCFGIIFGAVASAAATFGNEQVNYYRESAAGLQSIPYFFGKWLANIPRIVCAALFFWIAFSIKYQNTGSPGDLYLIILFLYWFGFSTGYVVSQLVPLSYATLTGVLVALVFAVALSGANPNMATVKTKTKGQQFFWAISGPRWALEAFYISGITYFENIPNTAAAFEGQPYEDINYGLDTIGYDVKNFYLDIHGLFWVGVGWGLFALLLMVCTAKSKKR